MLPKLLGLTGRKRSGKDTAAEALGGEVVTFAYPMKLMLGALLRYQGASTDLVEQMLNGDLKETPSPLLGGHTPRFAMQRLGTEWGRTQMGEDFWVSIALNRVEELDPPRAIIPDVRFPNEAAAIRARGGEVWRIRRPGRPVSEGDEHSSEVLIDTLDVEREITNDQATAEEFQAELHRLVVQ